MQSSGASAPNILLYAIEEPLAKELSSALAGLRLPAPPESFKDLDGCLRRLDNSGAGLVFSSFSRDFLALLAATSSGPRKVPVVVVSRCPEVKEWLDAMEAGAADYCAAPFEHRQLEWILSASLAGAARNTTGR